MIMYLLKTNTAMKAVTEVSLQSAGINYWLCLVTIRLLTGLILFMPLGCSDDDQVTPNSNVSLGERYIRAIETEELNTLDNLFDDNIVYALQFPVTPDGSVKPVIYRGKQAVVAYFRTGFAGFDGIQNQELQIDATTNPAVIWVRYRQTASLPQRLGVMYDNIVVERITFVNGRIQEIILYESPDRIRQIL